MIPTAAQSCSGKARKAYQGAQRPHCRLGDEIVRDISATIFKHTTPRNSHWGAYRPAQSGDKGQGQEFPDATVGGYGRERYEVSVGGEWSPTGKARGRKEVVWVAGTESEASYGRHGMFFHAWLLLWLISMIAKQRKQPSACETPRRTWSGGPETKGTQVCNYHWPWSLMRLAYLGADLNVKLKQLAWSLCSFACLFTCKFDS